MVTGDKAGSKGNQRGNKAFKYMQGGMAAGIADHV
jgi:hypothetical protein